MVNISRVFYVCFYLTQSNFKKIKTLNFKKSLSDKSFLPWRNIQKIAGKNVHVTVGEVSQTAVRCSRGRRMVRNSGTFQLWF